ncbi:MAG: hypothetical protein CR989_04760 [Flavobacteriales bacterium]|nr:MAG: hypothetical protein CR989_04760 [Flavobacteriales bacterium]
MSSTKKIVLFIFLFLLVGLGWYFFVKPFDYQITFRARTSPGTVYQGVKFWAGQLEKKEGISIKTITVTPFKEIIQELSVRDTVFRLNWSFEGVNDSITKVRIGVVDTQNSLQTRLKIPFLKTWLEQFSLSKVIEFKKGLEAHLNNFKVRVEGKSKIPEKFYAYVTVSCTQSEKANKMIANNFLMAQFLSDNAIEMNGYPFLEIKSWDMDTEEIVFDFCFPIDEIDNFPNDNVVKFKKMESKPALKAIYNGNYRISDRA